MPFKSWDCLVPHADSVLVFGVFLFFVIWFVHLLSFVYIVVSGSFLQFVMFCLVYWVCMLFFHSFSFVHLLYARKQIPTLETLVMLPSTGLAAEFLKLRFGSKHLEQGRCCIFPPSKSKVQGCKMYCTVLGGHHSSRNDGGFLEVIFDSSHLDQTQDSWLYLALNSSQTSLIYSSFEVGTWQWRNLIYWNKAVC